MERESPLREYGRLVSRHWYLWGLSVVFAILGAVSLLTPIDLPLWLWIVLIVLPLSLAQFLAFRDVARQRETIRGQVETSAQKEEWKRNIRDQLAKFIEQGEIALYYVKENAAESAPDEGTEDWRPLWLRRAQGWADEVDGWLRRTLGYSYAKGFERPMGVTPTHSNPILDQPGTARHHRVWRSINLSMEKLGQYVEEFKPSE